jgi:hypothetical protein
VILSVVGVIMVKKKKSNNLSFLKKRVSLSYLQITLFALLFAGVGVFAILQSSAAPRSSAVLTGPSSLVKGTTVTVQGSGFKPCTSTDCPLVALELTSAGGCCSAFNVAVDSQGKFTTSPIDVYELGYYKLRASEKQRNGSWRVVATWEAYAK